MAILESGEMYVETIYLLSLESDKVRGKDISEYMGFSRPSVSRALNSLRERGLVKKDKNGYIKLTEGGIILAKHIYDRNMLIARHFTGLGVDEKTARKDAQMVERFISDTTFNAIRDNQIKNGVG
ncbi:MAG: metal-dependent transcriptional regulator [Clostridiales bacterium]|nr:metal-dependent transcriptional regulator [Clostridiales bacterium]